MRTYGQYCPIARASELLGERWSIIILRNILVGCQTFNEIAAGAPGLSRGLLSRRLRELEQAGVIEIRHKPDRPGSTYEPTPAGRELSEVMFALENWARKWVELRPEHAHPDREPGRCARGGDRSGHRAGGTSTRGRFGRCRSGGCRAGGCRGCGRRIGC